MKNPANYKISLIILLNKFSQSVNLAAIWRGVRLSSSAVSRSAPPWSISLETKGANCNPSIYGNGDLDKDRHQCIMPIDHSLDSLRFSSSSKNHDKWPWSCWKGWWSWYYAIVLLWMMTLTDHVQGSVALPRYWVDIGALRQDESEIINMII